MSAASHALRILRVYHSGLVLRSTYHFCLAACTVEFDRTCSCGSIQGRSRTGLECADQRVCVTTRQDDTNMMNDSQLDGSTRVLLSTGSDAPPGTWSLGARSTALTSTAAKVRVELTLAIVSIQN
jgi:hypothetical protein